MCCSFYYIQSLLTLFVVFCSLPQAFSFCATRLHVYISAENDKNQDQGPDPCLQTEEGQDQGGAEGITGAVKSNSHETTLN